MSLLVPPLSSTMFIGTPLLNTAPSDEPGDPPPTTEPDTSGSDLGNLTPPEEELVAGVGQVAIDDPNYAVPSYGTRIVNISTRGKVVGSASDDALVGGVCHAWYSWSD